VDRFAWNSQCISRHGHESAKALCSRN